MISDIRKRSKKYYIGIANTCHDPAVAVVNEKGEILFAEALERYFQQKKAWDIPPDHGGRIREVIEKYCEPGGEFVIASPWKTLGLFGLQAEKEMDAGTGASSDQDGPARGSLFGASDGEWLAWSQTHSFAGFGNHVKWMLRHYFKNDNVQFRQYDHHLAHAAMACYTSPYKEALCLVADGEGEVGAASSYLYRNGKLNRLQRSWGPGSLGSFYAKITELCGFDWRKGEEGKVMGLAASGEYQKDIFDAFKSLVEIKALQVRFPAESELAQRLCRMEKRLREKAAADPRLRENIAHNGQMAFEMMMTRLLNALYDKGESGNLVLGGGCALNSAYNGKVIEETPFTSVHVPCAPADDGNALGAAFLAFHEDQPAFFPSRAWQSPYLGSPMDSASLNRMKRFLSPDNISCLPGRIYEEAAGLLARGRIIGWVQGRAEYGPRALGNRSILADPRGKNVKDRINAQVKFREAFRPFAPVLPEDAAADWFENPIQSPYMSFTRPWKTSRASIVPAVVHKDGTGRLQTVTKASNPEIYALLQAFAKLTGVPVLLNTSLNIMGKPIVHSLEDVLGIFYTTGLDALVIGDLLIEKKDR